jgi:hypothetical protein
MTSKGNSLLEFKVFVDNKPGELARVTEALAVNAVNIVAIASEITNAMPFYRIVTNDVNTTRKALQMAGLNYEENEILVAELIDRPGELAKVARRLARANVNISSIYMLGTKDGKTQIAMTVDNLQRAKQLLKA